MEYGTNNNRMKIVWLCHFVNQEMKNLFNAHHVRETAPWINNLIELFRERTDVELHIVAPNVFINTNHSVTIGHIHYHFYRHRPNFIPIKIYSFSRIATLTDFWYQKNKIYKIITSLNPDIIHLHGAENPYYSSGVLTLKEKYPILVTIQGFVRNSSTKGLIIRKRVQIEEEIIKSIKHFGTRTNEMNEIIVSLNPNAILHFHNYPCSIPKYFKGTPHEFDIIFFAKICKDKGIEDLLEALAIVKQSKPDISLQIIGTVDKSYKKQLDNKVAILNITKNVTFLGFMQTQEDIYKRAVKAQICVLPTYHDIIPGTIIESMFMKIPVIAYAVGGIPELNKKEVTIMLVDKQNIDQLAEKIVLLLNNADLRKTLAQKAYVHAKERFNNNNVVIDILNAYKSILNRNSI